MPTPPFSVHQVLLCNLQRLTAEGRRDQALSPTLSGENSLWQGRLTGAGNLHFNPSGSQLLPHLDCIVKDHFIIYLSSKYMVLDGSTDNHRGRINVLSISRPRLELGFQLGGSGPMGFPSDPDMLGVQWYNHISRAYVYIKQDDAHGTGSLGRVMAYNCT